MLRPDSATNALQLFYTLFFRTKSVDDNLDCSVKRLNRTGRCFHGRTEGKDRFWQGGGGAWTDSLRKLVPKGREPRRGKQGGEGRAGLYGRWPGPRGAAGVAAGVQDPRVPERPGCPHFSPAAAQRAELGNVKPISKVSATPEETKARYSLGETPLRWIYGHILKMSPISHHNEKKKKSSCLVTPSKAQGPLWKIGGKIVRAGGRGVLGRHVL
ncbi:uncharacterized protein LOC115067800 [Nannospalax galili]|uniref:uncharacterized protein LOC115067800 n=1 Tax=Nannospalax galili TaxID=1026970 RepID=UPI00111C1115|nr:uncharacterized protein LOC115067800 [Nannospalax galili]